MSDQDVHDEHERARSLWERGRTLYREHKFKEALEIYRSLAETGRAGADLFMLLASMYGHGVGTNKDPEEAERWTEKAANAGYPSGQLSLARVRLQQGRYDGAREWLERAVAQGYPPAIYLLGKIYEDGEWAPADKEKAYRYFEEAAAKGHLWAQRALAGRLIRGEYGLLRIPGGLIWLVKILWSAARIKLKDPSDERIRV